MKSIWARDHECGGRWRKLVLNMDCTAGYLPGDAPKGRMVPCEEVVSVSDVLRDVNRTPRAQTLESPPTQLYDWCVSPDGRICTRIVGHMWYDGWCVQPLAEKRLVTFESCVHFIQALEREAAPEDDDDDDDDSFVVMGEDEVAS